MSYYLERLKLPKTTTIMTLNLSFRILVVLTGLITVQGQPGHGVHEVNRQDVHQECSILGNDNVICNSEGLFSQLLDDSRPRIDDDEEEEDPMLEKMPGLDFKAYKRADISSLYNEPPGSRVEKTPDFAGQAAKFVNMGNERLDLYW
jgi:hypothetical protein